MRLTIPLNPCWRLTLIGVATLVTYALGLVWPYSLFRWWQFPRQNLGTVMGYAWGSAAVYILVLGLAFFLYWLALQLVRERAERGLWIVVMAGAVGFNGVLLLLHPIAAQDVFDYIIRGRMQVLYQGNPFYDIPAKFAQDPFFAYSNFPLAPTAYGPLWEMLAAGVARWAGDGVIFNVLAFKAVCILAYGGTTALIGLTLGRTAPERALQGVVLFAWNPLILYSVAGNAHNDSVMSLFIALGFYCLARGWFTLAAVAQTAGALVKFIPALLLPIVVLVALKRLPDHAARLRYLLGTAAICATLVVIVYAPYWQGGDVVSAGRRTSMFTTSLPSLLQIALGPAVGDGISRKLVSLLALAALAICLAWQLWRIWRRSDGDAPVRGGLIVLLFFLLLACPWFQPHYVIWPLALAALLPPGPLVYGTLLFSLAVTWKWPLRFIILSGPTPTLARAWRETWLTLLTLGLPWLYFLVRAWRPAVVLRASRHAGARTVELDAGNATRRSSPR